MTKEEAKEIEIIEIQRRIAYLIYTDEISDTDKIAIARRVLNLIQDSQKDGE